MKKHIKHFFAKASGKCTTIERWIRTLHGRISRYKNAFNTNRFIDILDQLVAGYNKSFHSSITMTPYSVNKDNEYDVYNNLDLGKIEIKKKSPYQFKLGGVFAFRQQNNYSLRKLMKDGPRKYSQ